MYRSILVPLDGSPFSEQALPYARNIARWAGATLDLAHVHTLPVTSYVDGTPIVVADEDVRRSDELAYLTEMAQRQAGATDRNVTATLLDGPIVDAISSHAIASEADLIVMTTHGRGAISRFWLGSVADRLVRQAPMPVLLVRPAHKPAEAPRDPTFSHVLIPLDGSILAEHIINHAVALGSLAQARYTLIQIVEPMTITYSSPPMTVCADNEMLDIMCANAEKYLESVAERLRAQSIQVETKVVLGTAAPTIIDYAEQHNVDLIAMGTHGRGGLSRMLLGSVADKVVRAACVPTLLHRPGHEGDSDTVQSLMHW